MNTIRGAGSIVVCTVLVVAITGPRASASPREFDWPLRPKPQVTAPFDRPEHDWLPGHRGVDLAASENQPVLAVGDGRVVFAGQVAGKPVVSVDHPNGLRSTYEPVVASVEAGARVHRGDRLGSVALGHDHCSAPCLHWGIRRDRDYLDPTALVRTEPVVLKPLVPA